MFQDPRKRKINLGTTTRLSKEELLLKNKQEREQRELTLKKYVSAKKIAKYFRNYKSKARALDYIWDMTDVGRNSGSDVDLLALLLLFKLDRNRYPNPEAFVEASITKVDWNSSVERMSFLIPRLFKLYFSVGLLAGISQGVIEANTAHPIPKKILARILNCISGQLVMSNLTLKLQSSGSESEKSMIFSIILNIMVLGFESGVNPSHQDFIEKILVIPSFFESMPKDQLQLYTRRYPFYGLLSALGGEGENLSASTTQMDRLTIFANFIFLAVKMDAAFSTPNHWSLYLNILNKFLQDIPAPINNKIALDDADSDDEMRPLSVLDRPHLKILQELPKSTHIIKVIKAGNSDISTCCTFLVGLMSRFRAERLQIASVVLFQHDKSFLRDCLQYYLQSPLATIIQTDIVIALGNPVYTSDWYCLVIVCEFYARMLLTVSNEEFFNSPATIPVELFVSLTGTLKNVAFHLFWSIQLNIAAPLLSVSYMQDLIPCFLSQIHNRETRKRFCPDGHWFVPSIELMATLDQIPAALQSEESEQRVGDRVNSCLLILEKIPFIISFADRVKLFRSFLAPDVPGAWISPKFRAEVRRGQVFEDGYAQLNALGSRLRERIAISFIDQHGLPEAGIDGGGVFKEFLTDCLKQAFQQDLGLFVETRGHLLYPSPSEYASQEEQLKLFEFLGRIIGKAMYEKVLLEIPFAVFFLAKWLGRKSQLDDLPLLDEELYNGLIFLKNYQGDVSDLCLTFCVTTQQLGETKTIPLIPNGHLVPITKENRMQYIYMVANYKLNTQIARPCKYFFHGLSDLIRPEWLRMFSEAELQVLLGGEQAHIDPNEMKKHVVYDSIYDKDHPTIVLFWLAVENLSHEDRSLLLKFITSCSRPPLLGFSELNPRICIRFSGQEESRLPTASTCINLLKLPAYTTLQVLTEKLVYAIRSQSGFELS